MDRLNIRLFRTNMQINSNLTVIQIEIRKASPLAGLDMTNQTRFDSCSVGRHIINILTNVNILT